MQAKRVFNESKTTELTTYDLARGYLKEDKLFVAHHEAQTYEEEQFHYEPIGEPTYAGGAFTKIVDVPAKEASEAYDEYEDILVYISYTAKELASREIAELKMKLTATDYKAIKYAEGEMSASEYAPIKAERAAWRARINELEEELQ